jgi:hypothetical protein
MKIINRVNRIGLQYHFIQDVDRPDCTIVRCDVPDGAMTGGTKERKEMQFSHHIDKLKQSWDNWMTRGELIQRAFDYLSSDEREFLMTGITPAEWDKMFGETK